MKIEKEDKISVIITICLLLIWYLTLTLFNYPVISILILWAGMILLSATYFIIYSKKKRDMKIFKIRFFLSALPIYPALGFYVYILLTGDKISGVFRLLPIGIVCTMLLINASVVYLYSRKILNY